MSALVVLVIFSLSVYVCVPCFPIALHPCLRMHLYACGMIVERKHTHTVNSFFLSVYLFLTSPSLTRLYCISIAYLCFDVETHFVYLSWMFLYFYFVVTNYILFILNPNWIYLCPRYQTNICEVHFFKLKKALFIRVSKKYYNSVARIWANPAVEAATETVNNR